MFQTTSLSDTYISCTIRSAGSYCPRPVYQPAHVEESFPFLGPTQSIELHGIVAGVAHQVCGGVAHQAGKSNRPTKCCAFFLVMGKARWNNLSFIIEGLSLHSPHHGTPKNFAVVEGLLYTFPIL